MEMYKLYKVVGEKPDQKSFGLWVKLDQKSAGNKKKKNDAKKENFAAPGARALIVSSFTLRSSQVSIFLL